MNRFTKLLTSDNYVRYAGACTVTGAYIGGVRTAHEEKIICKKFVRAFEGMVIGTCRGVVFGIISPFLIPTIGPIVLWSVIFDKFKK